MQRKIVDINTLDELVRDELNKVESAAAFGISLWRHKLDETGANWNGSVRRIGDTRSLGPTLTEILPKLRATFSLDGRDD